MVRQRTFVSGERERDRERERERERQTEIETETETERQRTHVSGETERERLSTLLRTSMTPVPTMVLISRISMPSFSKRSKAARVAGVQSSRRTMSILFTTSTMGYTQDTM